MQVSWDQNEAHHVLERWVSTTMDSGGLSGIMVAGENKNRLNGQVAGCVFASTAPEAHALREIFVRDCMNAVDQMFGRKLGCRISDTLRKYVDEDNHVKRKEEMNKARAVKQQAKEAQKDGKALT
jgi:hypothetical protein